LCGAQKRKSPPEGGLDISWEAEAG
jgi:hypothetical protein